MNQMVSIKTRNISMMILLMVLAIAGAIPVVLLIAGLFIATGPGTGGGISGIAGALGTLAIQIILGVIVVGVLAIGLFLVRRTSPLQ